MFSNQKTSRFGRRLVSRTLLVMVGCVLGACSGEGSSGADTAPKTLSHYFPIKVGDKIVRMQVAVRPEEMQRGLMGRRDLGPDDGLLFVYQRPQQLQFWMRNTPTPLDIGFFDSGGILQEIYPLHPFDEAPVGSRSTRLQFALEVHQGWYRGNGVQRDATLDLEAVADALKQRGFEPWRFGMPRSE
ncbi:MAG: DUF192 domain-containing protein [Opitutus sp.]